MYAAYITNFLVGSNSPKRAGDGVQLEYTFHMYERPEFDPQYPCQIGLFFYH